MSQQQQQQQQQQQNSVQKICSDCKRKALFNVNVQMTISYVWIVVKNLSYVQKIQIFITNM